MIIDNIEKIRTRIRAAAQRAGRNPDSVSLVAVTKYAKLEAVKELLDSGLVAEVGENRVQEAQAKKQALGAAALKARWRMIGHLQTNKAKKALELFDAVDSLDDLRVAEALERGLAGGQRRFPVLVQVKLTGKAAQSGVAPEGLEELLEGLKGFPHLEARGLMAIAPELSPVEAVRPHFRDMRRLFDRFFAGEPAAQLSMGMSRDFEIAVEEGATHIRVGSQIFS